MGSIRLVLGPGRGNPLPLGLVHDSGAISVAGGDVVIGLPLSYLLLPLQLQGEGSNLMCCVAEAPNFGDLMMEPLLAASSGCRDAVILSIFWPHLADAGVSLPLGHPWSLELFP